MAFSTKVSLEGRWSISRDLGREESINIVTTPQCVGATAQDELICLGLINDRVNAAIAQHKEVFCKVILCSCFCPISLPRRSMDMEETNRIAAYHNTRFINMGTVSSLLPRFSAKILRKDGAKQLVWRQSAWGSQGHPQHCSRTDLGSGLKALRRFGDLVLNLLNSSFVTPVSSISASSQPYYHALPRRYFKKAE